MKKNILISLCYWTMPFRKKCRITFENINPQDQIYLYYQIDYIEAEIPVDAAYSHAQFRRTNPDLTGIHTLVDGMRGKGQYVGTYLAWQVNNNGWWGEGEIKFFMDGEAEEDTLFRNLTSHLLSIGIRPNPMQNSANCRMFNYCSGSIS